MIIAVWTVLVALLILRSILSEAFLALFAGEDHVVVLCERVIGGFAVAVGAVEPFLAAGRADGDLSVEDVLAVFTFASVWIWWREE